MPLLNHQDIAERMNADDPSKRLIVTPLLEFKQVGEASVDLRLATEFLDFSQIGRAAFDAGDRQEVLSGQTSKILRRRTVPFGEKLWLHPGRLILGATLEFIQLPDDLGAYVLGRSSWGRVGLLVATAIMVQPGYVGALTLELVNESESPIALYPGLRIAQLAVHTLADYTKVPYSKKEEPEYIAPTRPEPAAFSSEQEEVDRVVRLGDALAGYGADGAGP